MEPPINNMFPCSPREHNAQAPQGATVIVARKRVFPFGKKFKRTIFIELTVSPCLAPHLASYLLISHTHTNKGHRL